MSSTGEKLVNMPHSEKKQRTGMLREQWYKVGCNWYFETHHCHRLHSSRCHTTEWKDDGTGKTFNNTNHSCITFQRIRTDKYQTTERCHKIIQHKQTGYLLHC